MGSAVSLSTSSGSGQARSSSSAAGGVQELSFGRMKKDLQEAAEAEGAPRLKPASSSIQGAADPPLHSGPYDYFEKQTGAWCGMHALNNLRCSRAQPNAPQRDSFFWCFTHVS